MNKSLIVSLFFIITSAVFAQTNPALNNFRMGAATQYVPDLGLGICFNAQAAIRTGSKLKLIDDVVSDLEWGVIIYNDDAGTDMNSGIYYSLDAMLSYETKFINFMTGLGIQSDISDQTNERVFYFPVEVCSDQLISLDGGDVYLDFAVGSTVFPDFKSPGGKVAVFVTFGR